MRVAAIDIGTNSTRLLVVEQVDGELIELERRQTVTALGRGVDGAGYLAADAIGRTVDALATYATVITYLGASRARATATSACRDAANVDSFFDPAEAVLGFRPEVISGHEEAARSYRGATSRLSGVTDAVVIDTGGGSTEFVNRDGGVSVDIGSIRLTERCLPGHPAAPTQLAAARAEAARMISRHALPTGASTIGVAGTWTSLSAMHQQLDGYDRDRVHDSTLTSGDVTHLVDWLATLTLADKEAIPSLDTKRAPVILGGAIVAEASLDALGHDEIRISEYDILDGVALGLLEN